MPLMPIAPTTASTEVLLHFGGLDLRRDRNPDHLLRPASHLFRIEISLLSIACERDPKPRLCRWSGRHRELPVPSRGWMSCFLGSVLCLTSHSVRTPLRQHPSSACRVKPDQGDQRQVVLHPVGHLLAVDEEPGHDRARAVAGTVSLVRMSGWPEFFQAHFALEHDIGRNELDDAGDGVGLTDFFRIFSERLIPQTEILVTES